MCVCVCVGTAVQMREWEFCLMIVVTKGMPCHGFLRSLLTPFLLLPSFFFLFLLSYHVPTLLLYAPCLDMVSPSLVTSVTPTAKSYQQFRDIIHDTVP